MSRFENIRILTLVAAILLGLAAESHAGAWGCSDAASTQASAPTEVGAKTIGT